MLWCMIPKGQLLSWDFLSSSKQLHLNHTKKSCNAISLHRNIIVTAYTCFYTLDRIQWTVVIVYKRHDVVACTCYMYIEWKKSIKGKENWFMVLWFNKKQQWMILISNAMESKYECIFWVLLEYMHLKSYFGIVVPSPCVGRVGVVFSLPVVGIIFSSVVE